MRVLTAVAAAVCSGALVLPWTAGAFAQGPAPAEALPAEALPALRVQAIDKSMAAAMARLGIPGLTAAVALDGERVWSKGYGLADVENEVLADEDTMYRLASVTKPMTAVAVLQLVERGKLDLNAPVQRYAPSFPAKPWPITARLLLSHQAGLRHWNDDEWGLTRHYASLDEALGLFKDDTLLFEPGSKAQYSSPGYNLLGRVVEGASGQPYLAYLRENVFAPAGMETARDDAVLEIIPHRARGYSRASSGELRNSRLSDTSNKTAGGGLIATAADVARFGAALLDAKLLQRATLLRMCTRQKTKDGRATEYGLGLHVTEKRNQLEAWHQGGQPQVSTILYLRPARGLSVALLCNLEGVSPQLVDLAREVADLALGMRRTRP